MGFPLPEECFPDKLYAGSSTLGVLGRLFYSAIPFQERYKGVSLAELCRGDSLLCKPSVPVCKTPCPWCSYPVEVLEVELFEDGVSAFHLIPPHSLQVWQQLLPLLRAQPVGFSCLAPWEGKGREDQCGRGGMKQMFKAMRHPMGRGVTGTWRQLQSGWEGWNTNVLFSLPGIHSACTKEVQLVPSVLSPATPHTVPDVLRNDTCVKLNSKIYFILHIIFWGKKKSLKS